MASSKNKISRLPETLDLALYAGDGVSIRISLTTSDGNPITVPGTVKAQIRKARSDSTVAAEFTATPVDGAVIISLTGTQTAALVPDEHQFSGVWDLQWIPDGGQPTTLVRGAVTCDGDVTR